ANTSRILPQLILVNIIQRMRKLYSYRRELFIEQLINFLIKCSILEITEAWLHFFVWLRRKTDLPLITRVCSEIGFRPSPLSSCFMKAEPEPALTFGFAAWSRAQIREGLSKFAAALNSKLN